MYSPVYSAGIYPPHTMYLPVLPAASAALGPAAVSTATSSPLLPSAYYAPYSVAPLSGAASPTFFSAPESVDNLPLIMVENTPSQLRKLFIGGLNHETGDDELREFYMQFGIVVDSIVIKDPITKQSRGFGFVTFATMDMADSAMAARPHTITGKIVDPKRAIAREQMLQLQNGTSPPTFLIVEPAAGCKLAIFEIDWEVHTVEDLRKYFERFGDVEQVEILGQPRGHGFVVFETREHAERCLARGTFHALNLRFIEVREYSEVYGYNIQYAGGGGTLFSSYCTPVDGPLNSSSPRNPNNNNLHHHHHNNANNNNNNNNRNNNGHGNHHNRHQRNRQSSSLASHESANCTPESSSTPSDAENLSPKSDRAPQQEFNGVGDNAKKNGNGRGKAGEDFPPLSPNVSSATGATSVITVSELRMAEKKTQKKDNAPADEGVVSTAKQDTSAGADAKKSGGGAWGGAQHKKRRAGGALAGGTSLQHSASDGGLQSRLAAAKKN